MPRKAALTPNYSSTNSSGSTRAWPRGGVFSLAIIENRPGILVFEVEGPHAAVTFAHEAGGHRWQRVPPTEKRGRVQTSTVTVAVLPEATETQCPVNDRDLEWATCRGSGAGGQHRNMTDSAVIVTHRPTGLSVRCESERSQHANKRSALALLRSRLWQRAKDKDNSARAAERRDQLGSGMRGDKRRTIRCQDEQVVDHVTGRRWRLKDYLRGEW